MITETLEDKANGLATKLNELGGMDDGHPRFGKLNLSKMSDDDIDDLMSSDMSYEDDDEDLKGAVLLFSSDAGKHITGQTLAVDGGVSAVLS